MRGSICPSLAFTLLKRIVIFLAFLVFKLFLVWGLSWTELLFVCLLVVVAFFFLDLELLMPPSSNASLLPAGGSLLGDLGPGLEVGERSLKYSKYDQISENTDDKPVIDFQTFLSGIHVGIALLPME